MTGLFITFEGPDGAGKTTQVRAFAKVLESRGFDVLVTREPGGTVIGDRIRDILLDPSVQELSQSTEVLLYAAARAQHVSEKLVPALRHGKIVICDRFVDASIAYQGYGLGISAEAIETINRFATAGLEPDRTYLLDIPVEEGRKRLEQRAGLDRIEQKGAAYHEKVRAGFLQLASRFPERIRLVDGSRPVEDVHQELLADFFAWVKQYDKGRVKRDENGGRCGSGQG